MKKKSMNKKTAATALIVLVAVAIFLGFLFVNKGDGPVAGLILADTALEDLDTYNSASALHGDGIYLVASNAFNKFRADYESSIPANKNLYAAVHFVECPKGSEYTGKWIKNGTVLFESKGTLSRDLEGVISYMLDGSKLLKGSFVFALYDGEKKIFEQTFTVE